MLRTKVQYVLAITAVIATMVLIEVVPEEIIPSIEPPVIADQIRAFTINPENGEKVELAMPVYEECKYRDYYSVTLITKFWVSYTDHAQVITDPVTNAEEHESYTWVDARNHCRNKCMELLSLETPEKNKDVKEFLAAYDSRDGVWTAGKRCLGHECGGVLEPVHLNGWYWSTNDEMLHPADQTEEGWHENPWSVNGTLGKPQPDNAANLVDSSVIEACLAVRPDPDTQKLSWHDVPCSTKLVVVCEDAPMLVKYIEDSLNVTLQ